MGGGRDTLQILRVKPNDLPKKPTKRGRPSQVSKTKTQRKVIQTDEPSHKQTWLSLGSSKMLRSVWLNHHQLTGVFKSQTTLGSGRQTQPTRKQAAGLGGGGREGNVTKIFVIQGPSTF